MERLDMGVVVPEEGPLVDFLLELHESPGWISRGN